MRIVNVFGFFIIFCISQFNALFINLYMEMMKTEMKKMLERKCNTLEDSSPLLRLKNHLFCDYDSTIHPNYPKTTNVTMNLIPKLINLNTDQAKLSLHSWMLLSWKDPQLSWTPSDYDDIAMIHVKSWQIWRPNICVNNSAEMSDQYQLPDTECLLYSSGSVTCVPAVKFVAKCNPDYTYWPYDKQQCRVTFISWMHKGEEVNLLPDRKGISMKDFKNDTTWDFKFIQLTTEVRKYKCCPNDTFPRINYFFSLTRHPGKRYSVIVPAIALILLTITVLCLDLNSIERMTVASVNFICHFYCMYIVTWSIPFNGVNPPNILLFYRESLALATFAVILTVLLRKLENMSSTDIPNWISFTTTFVLSNKAGRFLILNDDESKVASRDIVPEENSDTPKSEMSIKKSPWKYFATIIDWLSFFCVIFTYAIILIILIPAS